MILSDKTILEYIKKGYIEISPKGVFKEKNVQPSSIDLHLDHLFRVFKNFTDTHIDIKKEFDVTELIDISKNGFLIMHPGEFLLGSTVEYVKIPDFLVGRMEGRSSFGRLGLIVHATAGYIDPGFVGNITLEMLNVSNIPIKLYPDIRIAQLTFEELTTPAMHPYGKAQTNKYEGQIGPTRSAIWKDFIK